MLAVLGCASGTRETRPAVPHTDAIRIIGVGAGNSADEARTRAVTDIGGQLRSTLESLTLASESASSRNGVVTSESIQRNTVQMSIRFEHPEWVEVLRLEAIPGGYEAVCAVDRARAARALEPRLRVDEAALSGQMELARKDGAALDVVQARAARERLVEGILLLASLRQAPVSWPAAVAGFDDWERTQRLQSPDVGIALCVTGDVPAGSGIDLEAALRAGLASRTQRVAACQEGTTGWTLKVQAAVSPRQDAQLPDVTFCTATLGGTLLDPGSRSTWAGTDLGGRATKSSGRDARSACSAALSHASRLMLEQLPLGRKVP